MNIDITTDKNEYKPGENINITFNTTNENKINTDAALLVSMLDNSILNLANNDLSIDNVRLALNDIRFTDELDAATLYSCIVNDKSEQAIMALLLKQKRAGFNISTSSLNGRENKDNSAKTAILLIAIIVIIISTYLSVKFKKIRWFLKHLINIILAMFIIILSLYLYMYFGSSLRGIINRRNNIDINYGLLIFAAIITLVIYIAFISKHEKKITRTSISILITFVLFIFFINIINVIQPIIWPCLIILALVMLAFTIIAKINEKKHFKISKLIEIVVKEAQYIVKYLFAVFLCIVGIISTPVAVLAPIVPFALLYFLNYMFNINQNIKQEEPSNKIKKKATNNQNIKQEISYNLVKKKVSVSWIILLLIIVILVILGIMSLISNFGTSMGSAFIDEAGSAMDRVDIQPNYGGQTISSSTPKNINPISAIVDTIDSFTSADSSKNHIENSLPNEAEMPSDDVANEVEDEKNN